MAGNKPMRELDRELNVDDDLRYLVNDLSEAKHKVIALAIQLGIKKATRDAFVRSTPDAGDMLIKILEEFLQKNGSDQVTRQSIIIALKAIELPVIAQEMELNYGTSPTAPKATLNPQGLVISIDSGVCSESKSDSSVDDRDGETESAVDELQQRNSLIKDATLECRLGFIFLRNSVRSSYKDGEYCQKIKTIILSVTTSYPPQLKRGLSTATSWDSAWYYLDKYTWWGNSRPIEVLASEKGNEKDEEYLREFIRKRMWVLKMLMKNTKYDERARQLVLKLDVDYNEFNEFNDENIEVVRRSLNTLLYCDVDVLKVEKGCVKITVTIPSTIAEDTFPLSPTKKEKFQRAFPFIISVTCGKIESFANTHYLEEEEKEETKSQDEEREEGKNEMEWDRQEDRDLESDSQKGELQKYNKLFKGAILESRIAFDILYNGVHSTCESGVSILEIKEIILPVTDYPPQLKTGISTAQSRDSVWSYLNIYTGWENSRPIEMLAIDKGSEKDKENLDEFTCKRKWLLQLLDMKYDKRTKELVLKLDMDYDEFKDENLEVVRLRLCSLLLYHVAVLKIERGCVIEEFQHGKIKESFANTHYSEEEEKEKEEEEEDTESQDKEREEGKNEMQSGDEEGFKIADKSGSDGNNKEHKSGGRRQPQESSGPQLAKTKPHHQYINITREQEADVEQEGGRMRGEDRYSCMTGSREDDRDLETHASESRILDRGELQEYNELFKGAIQEITVAFAKLRKGVCCTCKSGVGYQEIKEITLVVTNYPSQLKTGISTAQSWDSIWHYLDTYTGWKNSRPIEMLALQKGSERDKENLDQFTCKRKWLLELLEMKYDKRTKELVLKLDMDYNKFKDENLEVVRLHLCTLLLCHVAVLKIERGCVMITVAIPAETAEDVFPLFPTMREEFQRAFPSIIHVTCGKIKESFANTHYSEEEGRESRDKDEGIESHDEEEQSDDEEDCLADRNESDENIVEEQVAGTCS